MAEIHTSTNVGDFLSEVDLASKHGAKRVVVDEANDEKVSWHIESGGQRLARWFGKGDNARTQNAKFTEAVKQLGVKAQEAEGEERPLAARTVALLNEGQPQATKLRTVVKSLLTALQSKDISLEGLKAESAPPPQVDHARPGDATVPEERQPQADEPLDARGNRVFMDVVQHPDIREVVDQVAPQIEDLNRLIPGLKLAVQQGDAETVRDLVTRAEGQITAIGAALGRNNANALTTEAALAVLAPLREFFTSVLPQGHAPKGPDRVPEPRTPGPVIQPNIQQNPQPNEPNVGRQQVAQAEIPPGKLNRENIKLYAQDLPSLINQLDRALVSPSQRVFVDYWNPAIGELEYRVLSPSQFQEASTKRAQDATANGGPQPAPDYDNATLKQVLLSFTDEAEYRQQVSPPTAQALRSALDSDTRKADYAHNTQTILQLSEASGDASLWGELKAIESDRFSLPEPDYKKLAQYHPKVAAQAAHTRARQAEVLNQLRDDDMSKGNFLSVSERIERQLNDIENARPPKTREELAQYRAQTEEGIIQALSSVRNPATRLLMQSAISDLYGLMVLATTPGMRESTERLLRPLDAPLSPRALNVIATHQPNPAPAGLQEFEALHQRELNHLSNIKASAVNTVRVLKTQIDETQARLDVVTQQLRNEHLDATRGRLLNEQYTWLSGYRDALQQGLNRQLADVSGSLIEHTLRAASNERYPSPGLQQARYALDESYHRHRHYYGGDVDYRDALQYLKTFDGLINGEFYDFRSDSSPYSGALLDPVQASTTLRVANVVSSAYTQLEDIAQIMAEPAANLSDLSYQQTQEMGAVVREAQRLQSGLQQTQASGQLSFDHFLAFQLELHQLTMRYENALGGQERAKAIAADSTVAPVQQALQSLQGVTAALTAASIPFGGTSNPNINLPAVTKPTVATRNQSVQTPALPQFYGKSQLNGNCWIAAINAVFGEEAFPYADVQSLLKERFKADVLKGIPARDGVSFRRHLAAEFCRFTNEDPRQVERELIKNPDRVLDSLALFRARDDIANQLAYNYAQKGYPNPGYMAHQITAQMNWADVAFHVGGTKEDVIIKNIATGYKLASNPAEPGHVSALHLTPQDGSRRTLEYRQQQVAQFLADKDRVYLGRDGHATALRKTEDGRWYHIDSNNYYENSGLSAGAYEVDPVEFLARESRSGHPASIYGLPPLVRSS